jgi:hypothetical protein
VAPRVSHQRARPDATAGIALVERCRWEEVNEIERAGDVLARCVGLGTGLGLGELHPELLAGRFSHAWASTKQSKHSSASSRAPEFATGQKTCPFGQVGSASVVPEDFCSGASLLDMVGGNAGRCVITGPMILHRTAPRFSVNTTGYSTIIILAIENKHG